MMDVLIPQMCDLYGPVLEWCGMLIGSFGCLLSTRN